jgi:hypothetical protein
MDRVVPPARRSNRILLLLALLYLLITIVGLFPFRGIPILNVALGFPIGAAVAYRFERRLARAPGEPKPTAASPGHHAGGPPDAPRYALLRTLLTWALITAGMTMFVCWAELLYSLLTIKFFGPFVASSRWTPLLPTAESPNLYRAQLFAVIISPGLQILTTVFGGVVAVLIGPRR